MARKSSPRPDCHHQNLQCWHCPDVSRCAPYLDPHRKEARVNMLDLAWEFIERANWPPGQRSYTMEALKELTKQGWQLIPPREEVEGEDG